MRHSEDYERKPAREWTASRTRNTNGTSRETSKLSMRGVMRTACARVGRTMESGFTLAQTLLVAGRCGKCRHEAGLHCKSQGTVDSRLRNRPTASSCIM